MAGSPLNVISYNQAGSSPESQQAFRIYYQSALGNIKEAVSDGLSSWQSALYALRIATYESQTNRMLGPSSPMQSTILGLQL